MCVSAEVDIAAAIVIGGVAVDAVRHIERRDQILIGTLPAIFAAHQAIEVVVWWWAEGVVGSSAGRPATWLYLLVALVVLPTWIPLAVRNIEPDERRRRTIQAIVGVGVATSAVLLWQLVDGDVDVRDQRWHLQYVFGLDWPNVVIAGYLIATCAPLLVASRPSLRWYGIVNVIAVAVIAALSVGAVVSIWCVWAAVTSVAIAIYLRREQGDRAPDPPISVGPASGAASASR
jgi:4-hydroxybenzoate polyprenyltransferase